MSLEPSYTLYVQKSPSYSTVKDVHNGSVLTTSKVRIYLYPDHVGINRHEISYYVVAALVKGVEASRTEKTSRLYTPMRCHPRLRLEVLVYMDRPHFNDAQDHVMIRYC